MKSLEEDQSLDWLGRHPSQGKKLGGWPCSYFLLGAICFDCFAYSGVFINLVLYFIRIWGDSSASAANDVTNIMGTMFFTAMIGAFIGDAYLGRLWTTIIFLVTYILGVIVASIAITFQGSMNIHATTQHMSYPTWIRVLLSMGLYIAAIGNGSYATLLFSFGGDQFDSPSSKGSFFNWIFVACNIGQFVSLIFITHLQEMGHWALSFWILVGSLNISLLLIFMGAPKSRQYKAGGNPFVRIAQVFVCAIRKHSMIVESNSLHEVGDGHMSIIPGCRKLAHTQQFRWLDKAAIMTSDGKQNAWHICTITQVEEVKCLIRVIPFLVSNIICFIIYAQVTTFFVEQGANMDHHIKYFNATIPAASMQVITVVISIIFGVMYDYLITPILQRRTGKQEGLTSLQCMGWGIFVGIIAMVVAALVEGKRLRYARRISFSHDSSLIKPLSVYWLIPQYALLGIFLTFRFIGQTDFFYSELSDGMKSLGISLSLLSGGLGNYGSTLLVTLIVKITTREDSLGWIPRDLNDGHLDYFYWLLATLTTITLAFFFIFSYSYTYLRDHQPKETALALNLNDQKATKP